MSTQNRPNVLLIMPTPNIYYASRVTEDWLYFSMENREGEAQFKQPTDLYLLFNQNQKYPPAVTFKLNNASVNARYQLRIGGGDNVVFDKHLLLAVDHGTASHDPAGESCIITTGNRLSLSTDSDEGVSQALLHRTNENHDLWDDYLVIIESGNAAGSDSGSNDQLEIQFYDRKGQKIGGKFICDSPVFSNNAFANNVRVPLPNWSPSYNPPPLPVYASITTTGEDLLYCERIWVVRRPGPQEEEGRNATLSVFHLNAYLSTDSDEGLKTVDVSAEAYRPRSVGSPVGRTVTVTKAISSNAIGASSTVQPTEFEFLLGVERSISSTTESGESDSDSLTLGATASFDTGFTSGSVYSEYTKNWQEWSSSTGVQLYSTKLNSKVTLKVQAPPGTVRLRKWWMSYSVESVSLSDGFTSPVRLDLVPSQQFIIADDKVFDISATQHISWSEWEKDWKPFMSNDDNIEALERDLVNKGWIDYD